MQITDNAKVVLEQMLNEEGKNAVVFMIQGEGPNTQLAMDFAMVNEPDMIINGINVQMDYQTFVMLQDIILDFREGRLLIMNAAPSPCGGCGGGCGGGCSTDGDCGCGGCGC